MKSNETGLIMETEKFFQCCGYDLKDQANLPDWERISCIKNVPRCAPKLSATVATTISTPVTATNATNTTQGGRRKRDLPPDCPTCKSLIDTKIDKGFNAAGGLGLFFSLTEVGQP